MLSDLMKTTGLVLGLAAAGPTLAACEAPRGKVSVLQGDTVAVAPGST